MNWGEYTDVIIEEGPVDENELSLDHDNAPWLAPSKDSLEIVVPVPDETFMNYIGIDFLQMIDGYICTFMNPIDTYENKVSYKECLINGLEKALEKVRNYKII